jgi:hypothetical protein
MKRTGLTLITILCFCLLTACSQTDPGPLAGTWKQTGAMQMIVHFRPTETEALDVIEKVSYEVKGQDVLVTFKDGQRKGSTVRYTMIGTDMAKTEMGTLRRLKGN